MSDGQIKVGRKQQRISASGYRVLGYFVEMSHEGLNEHKVISAPEEYMLDNKIDTQKNKWREKWAIVSSRRENNQEKEANLDEANRRTQDAADALNTVENILLDSLSVNATVNWEKLKKKEHYTEQVPNKPYHQVKKNYPSKPVKEVPTFSFTENMFKSKKELKIKEYENRYSTALSNWEKEKASVDKCNQQLDLDYENQLIIWEKKVSQWEERKKVFLKKQEEFNVDVDKQKQKYLSKDPASIYEYFDMVLNNSKYPESFPSNFEVEYNSENKMLIIEYELPSQKDVPTLKEVKYIAARKEIKETQIPDNQINKMYDEIIYKITLRTIH
jgi:restriction system protein